MSDAFESLKNHGLNVEPIKQSLEDVQRDIEAKLARKEDLTEEEIQNNRSKIKHYLT